MGNRVKLIIPWVGDFIQEKSRVESLTSLMGHRNARCSKWCIESHPAES